MRVFVYEFMAGGGALGDRAPFSRSLLREGAAMVRALLEDLARIEGCQTQTMWDARLGEPPPSTAAHVVQTPEEERAAFLSLAESSHGVILIAPECAGVLLDRVRKVEEVGGRLLSPSAAFVAVAGDKHATCRRLSAAGVPTPFGIALRGGERLPEDFPYPAVLKPRAGAGSQDVYWVAHTPSERDPRGRAPAGDILAAGQLPSSPNPSSALPAGARLKECGESLATHPWRLEQYCPGMAASIALLCGPAGSAALPACQQLLSDDGRFRYLGGTTPLAPALHARAAVLAHRALDALPPAVGYVGFDLVLGDAHDGSQDAVIEVNPRLTTSYVGLRKAVSANLAELMLQVAQSALRASFRR